MFNDPETRSPISPTPQYPEKMGATWESQVAPNTAGGRGPLRFQEGIGTDTDVPHDFVVGARQGYETAGRGNHNKPVWIKPAGETLRERAHMGSAAWVEAPTFLSEFASEAFSNPGENSYEVVHRSGAHYLRRNATVVDD